MHWASIQYKDIIFSQYRNSYCGDKTVIQSSYPHYVISCTARWWHLFIEMVPWTLEKCSISHLKGMQSVFVTKLSCIMPTVWLNIVNWFALIETNSTPTHTTQSHSNLIKPHAPMVKNATCLNNIQCHAGLMFDSCEHSQSTCFQHATLLPQFYRLTCITFSGTYIPIQDMHIKHTLKITHSSHLYL